MSVQAPDPDPYLIARDSDAAAGGGEVGPQLARLGLGGMAGEVAELVPAQQGPGGRVAGPGPSPAQGSGADGCRGERGQRGDEADGGRGGADEGGDAVGEQAGEQCQAPCRGGPAAGAQERGDSGGDPDGARGEQSGREGGQEQQRCCGVARQPGKPSRAGLGGLGHGWVRKAVSVS